MCFGCFEEYGSPQIASDATRNAAEAVAEVYRHNSVGGNLHIIVDDWNIEDEHLAYCAESLARIKAGVPERFDDTNPQQVAAEARCLALFLGLTIEERAAALALHDGYLGAAPAS